MDTIRLEYLAERMRLQKESMREAIERDKDEAGVRALLKRIGSHPATTAERARLRNTLVFFGAVRYLEECGHSDEQVTTAINQAVEQGKVMRPSGSSEGAEKVAAALCALELEELGLATMASLQRVRISLQRTLAVGCSPWPEDNVRLHTHNSQMRKMSARFEKPTQAEHSAH